MRLISPSLAAMFFLASCAVAGEGDWEPSNPDGFCDAEETSIIGYYLVNIEIADYDCDPLRHQMDGGGMVVIGAHGYPHGSQYYLRLESDVWWEEAYDDLQLSVDHAFTAQSHESAPADEPFTSMQGSFCGEELFAIFWVELPSKSEDWDGLNSDCFASWSFAGYLKWPGDDADPE